MLILDTSIAAEWLLRDSQPPAQAYAQGILAEVRTFGAQVPPLWHYEMANVIVISLRRRRADTAETETFRRDLAELVLLTDDRLPETAASRILELAARHHLTAYDAAYLELAEHTRLPLATLDDALRRAATELGIPLV